eukprot:4430312-Pleurochrysis_carterae.AAC.2
MPVSKFGLFRRYIDACVPAQCAQACVGPRATADIATTAFPRKAATTAAAAAAAATRAAHEATLGDAKSPDSSRATSLPQSFDVPKVSNPLNVRDRPSMKTSEKAPEPISAQARAAPSVFGAASLSSVGAGRGAASA